eukprot:1156520-Pelagomonas_calceolata.AAC.10
MDIQTGFKCSCNPEFEQHSERWCHHQAQPTPVKLGCARGIETSLNNGKRKSPDRFMQGLRMKNLLAAHKDCPIA